MTETKKRIHVVVNPAAGQDEPILNVVNDVCRQYEVEWRDSITYRFGDATHLARQATEEGYDIVAAKGI